VDIKFDIISLKSQSIRFVLTSPQQNPTATLVNINFYFILFKNKKKRKNLEVCCAMGKTHGETCCWGPPTERSVKPRSLSCCPRREMGSVRLLCACAGLALFFLRLYLLGWSLLGFSQIFFLYSIYTQGCYVIFSYMVSSDVVYNGLHTREIHLDIHRAEGQPGQQHIYFKGDAN
jgi:hypothetical protein